MEFDNLNERYSAPFKREYTWYRGKTDYEPFKGILEGKPSEFSRLFIPFFVGHFNTIKAEDIVQVQPMAVPSGLAFYEEFRTKTDVNKLDKRKLLR